MKCEQNITTSDTASLQDRLASTVIIEMISEMDERDYTDLPPLMDAIDPDALNTVARDEGVTVSFQYAGYDVEIRGGSEIRVEKTTQR